MATATENGNPYGRFDEGDVAPAATPRRGALLHKKIIFLFACALLVGVCACMVATYWRVYVPSDSFIHAQANSFAYIKGKLAMVSFSKGQGSGFIVKQADKKYLITNEHVIRIGNGEMPQVLMLDGKDLKLGNCEISRDRDLMRFEVEANADALVMADTIPEIGDKVTIYGNSDGGGVSTQIHGEVLGVGGDRIEVSAQFVNGNSGSPVIDKNGKAIGVATYLTNYTNVNDWVKTGTRFNGIRRFATRIADMSWRLVDWNEYSRQIRNVNDFEYFLKSLLPYLVADYNDVAKEYLSYSEINRLEYNSLSNGLHGAMIQVERNYRRLVQDNEEWLRISKGKSHVMDYLKGTGNIDKVAIMKEYDAIALDKFAIAVERLFEFNHSLSDALVAGQKMLQESDINIPLLRNGSNDTCGIDRYYRTLDAFLLELNERCSSCSNVVDYAAKVMKSERENEKELGLVLLNHLARQGDKKAMVIIAESFEKRAGKSSLDDFIHDEQVQKWVRVGFEEGRKKLGLFLGELAYQKMQYKDAEEFWTAAGKAGSVDAWVRLGEFHSFKQEFGGGPPSLKSADIAREAFKNAYESFAGTEVHRKGARYYASLLVRNPTKKEDLAKADEIFSALIRENPEDAYFYEKKGLTLYILEHGHFNGRWKGYIGKAAELGSTKAKNYLSDQSKLLALYRKAMQDMNLPIGGVGILNNGWEIRGISDSSDLMKKLIELGMVREFKEDSDWSSEKNWGHLDILAIAEGGSDEWINAKNLSDTDLTSLFRGDVGTELTLRLQFDSLHIEDPDFPLRDIKIRRCNVERIQNTGIVYTPDCWMKADNLENLH